MKKTTVILIAILFFFSSTAYSIPQPIGVGGQIKINGVPVNGVEVTIKNLNTGETHTAITKTNQQGKSGFYATVIDCLKGDSIQLSISYNGNLYTKIETVDFSQPTIWINLSIETTSEPPGAGDNNPSPIPNGNHAPIADFTYTPLTIYPKTVITFRDNSSDLDNDIISWTWTIENNIFTGATITYAFQEPGNHTVTLVVTDKNKTMSIRQKKIYVVSNGNATETPSENITIFIQVKDDKNTPLSNAIVEIYKDNSLIQTVYTNDEGIASTSLPQGTYTIQAYHSDEYQYLTHTFFSNNENITVFLSGDNNVIIPTQPTSSTPNWILLIGVSITLFTIIFLFIGRWRKWI